MRRQNKVLAATAAAVLALSACAADEAGPEKDFPSQSIMILEPYGGGGTVDIGTRLLAAPWGEALGQDMIVTNMPGGNSEIAALHTLEQGERGYALGTRVGPTDAWVFNYVSDQVKLDDFAPVGGWGYQTFGLLVNTKKADAEGWDSAEDFFAALAEPGQEITFGGVPGSPTQVQALLMFEALGLDPADMNFVEYPGGGDTRTALAGGHIDAAVSVDYLSIDEFTDALLVFTDEIEHPEEYPDAPAWPDVSDAELQYQGAPLIVHATAEFAEANPDGFDKLVSTFKSSVESPEFASGMEEAGLGAMVQYMTPEQVTEALDATVENLSQFEDVLSQ